MYRDNASTGELVYLAFAGRVFALVKASGDVAWRRDFGYGEICLHVEDEVMFVACENLVVALDPRTGEVRWKTEVQLPASRPPLMLVDASAIFVSRLGEIACLSRNGELRWSDPLKGIGYGAPTLAVRGRSVKLESKSD